jgi:hypothetical protein
MQKPLALSIAACLALTGCNVFEKSATWDKAVKVRPAETTHDPDPSNAYAAKLHEAFAADGVEHKVVVYQYHYMTRRHEQAVGTRTAVIYRDNANPNYPWWLKDDRLNNPFWLPNGDLSKQVSFYIRRPAEVVEVKEYPGNHDGKSMAGGKSTIAFAKPAPKMRAESKPEPQVAVTRLTPAKKAVAPVVVRKPAPTPEPAKAPVIAKASEPVKRVQPEPVAKGPVTAIKAIAAVFTPKPAPEREPAPEPIAARSSSGSFWAPPTVLDPAQQPATTAPRDEHMEKLFKAKHGTDYNRFSPTDRRKMQELQKGVASRE